MKIVKVAKYRQVIDATFRSANVHYHSCVGAPEVRAWKESAKIWLQELEETSCARAKPEDHEQKEYALRRIKEALVKADQRIQQYEDELKANESTNEASLQKLIDASSNIEVIRVH